MANDAMDPIDPDAALMVAFQNGNTAAFEQLFQRKSQSYCQFYLQDCQ